MKDRLLEFLRRENKSSAQLAEEIGVQASGISHILSGRNNPSLDFTLKMLEKYQFISTDWLLFGKGSMYKEPKMQSLFDDMPMQRGNEIESDLKKPVPEIIGKNENLINLLATGEKSSEKEKKSVTEKSNEEIVKVVWFYDDNTFEEFYPRSR